MVNGDSELNSLASCFQSVVQDIKTSNSSLELVCSRAVKLANQLTTTMNCLVGFSDAVQVIGDSGKWSSRDIGTSLTRFCLRQRALETEMKALTTALLESFAAPLEKKGSEWKQRLNEIERRHQKNLKKTRSRKQSLTSDLIAEHRTGCSEILLEQRGQFITFAGLLLPVINAQLRLFEEGFHLKSVKETIEQNVEAKDHQAIVNTVIEDVCHNDNWRNRIASPTRNTQKSKTTCNDSNSSPSSSSMALSWNQGDTNSLYYGTVSSVGSCSRPQTLSSVNDFGKQRTAISAQTFVPPAGTPFALNSPSEFAKPPLPGRRYNEGDVYGNGIRTQNNSNLSISSNSINNVNNVNNINPVNSVNPHIHHHQQQRPLSFNGEDHLGAKDETHSLSEQISNLVDKLNDDIHMMCDQSLLQNGGESCPTTVRRLEPTRVSVDSIRRPDSINKPPPPERRNSTITAATPTAPSIFDLRNAGIFGHQSGPINGRAGSVQDLNQMPTHYADENYTGVVYRAPNYQKPPEPPNIGRPGSYTNYRPPGYQ